MTLYRGFKDDYEKVKNGAVVLAIKKKIIFFSSKVIFYDHEEAFSSQ